MKTLSQLKPNYAPVYAAAIYPGLAAIFQRHGYALAVHGSVARDFDLVAIAWAEEISKPDVVMADVMKEYAVRFVGTAERKPHGRIAHKLSVGFGECAIDLSFLETSAA